MSSLVSEEYDLVIGVDTHAATHTFAVVAGSTGAVLSHAIFPTSPAGLERAKGWLVWRCGDARTLIVIEGKWSFGAIVTERLMAEGRTVVEAARMPAGDRRGKSKSDELDAVQTLGRCSGSPSRTCAFLERSRAIGRESQRGSSLSPATR